ncbi:MAG: Hsp70 family protein [Phycisphaerae bacterium]|nr:Hsp70 family protein [Phycisphaerae bacterium]
MTRIGVDFGTGNTVIAIFNEALGRVETLQIPGITTPMRYRLGPNAPEQIVHATPSLVYYSDKERLIGDQVLSRGLAEHNDTFRWMKRAIAQGNKRRKKTAQGFRSAAEAGTDFLTLLLNYASDRLDFANDEFTFTAPVEAFETFQDWLRTVAESLGIKRFRMLDEPTACVLGYHGAARKDEHFLAFDFGCGTLDVSIVKLDLASVQDRKAIQLGQAGRDLGGMNLDHWLAEDFCRRHNLGESDRRDLEAVILRRAEEAKIALSDPNQSEADMTVPRERGGQVRMLKTTYHRCCPRCRPGAPGHTCSDSDGCLGCLLTTNDFLKETHETLDHTLENAAVKAGVRRDSIVKVLVTGGTSLVPSVGELLRGYFDGRVELQSPFDAVASGACRGVVAPILQHDYAIESYRQENKEYEFKPLFKIGTDYPTRREAVKLWARGSYDGMTRIGLKIFEVSRVKRRKLETSLVDDGGVFVPEPQSRVATEFQYVCLNCGNPTFILADPPVNLQRDQKRFLCSFWVDGHRRLLVTVLDNFHGKILMQDHPVVRL